MYRKLVLHCPVSLDDLERLDPVQRKALLRYLTFDGVEVVSVVARGGDRRPLVPDAGEAMFIEPSADGQWAAPAEERFGRRVRVGLHVMY